MEFYPQDAASAADAAACAALFAGHTVLLVGSSFSPDLSPPRRPDLPPPLHWPRNPLTKLCIISSPPCLQPAVSNANLGQLTLDLLVNTLLQNGEAFVRATASPHAVFRP